jgi:hypothetical protein
MGPSLHFSEMMRSFKRFPHVSKMSTLTWICIILSDWNNNVLINMSLHMYILPLFWINQSLVFLINMMCLEKKQQTPSHWFDPTRYRTHNLLHTRPALWPLHHCCGLKCRNRMIMETKHQSWFIKIILIFVLNKYITDTTFIGLENIYE